MFSKKENFLLMLFIVFALIFGINQLSKDNDIFAETLVYCCNAGYCHENNCSSPASVKITLDDCFQDYIVDCFTCMDYKEAGLACSYTTAEHYCWNGSEKYYGEWAR